MKYYVLSTKKDVIYGGTLAKASNPDARRDVMHNIKVYYKKNVRGEYEEFPNTDLHIDLVLSKNFAKGLVTEYPTLDAAKKALSK